MDKKKKLCFAASTGGHFEQLMMLRPLMEQHDNFILTEKTDYSVAKSIDRVYYLSQVNRKEKGWLFAMVKNAFQSLGIFLKERPDAIICTGVLATIPMCLLCKLFGKKLIYIESFAKVTSPTETGKLMYRYADRFYVQWESMLEIYPDAVYLGGIY
ncbi:MAG: polysaccharide biosynthesis protein [Oscillospiraceae bacterium]|nr:polysaccharide biosynthesis protein [Oscillospiraceae bacterium]